MALLAGLQALGRGVGLNERSGIEGADSFQVLCSFTQKASKSNRLEGSMKRLLSLSLLACQFWGLNGCARSVPEGYQVKVLYPEEITPEDRAQFTDALDKYPRKELPRVKWSQTVFAWIDSTHVALSVRETPDGWKAKDGELARIIIIDTDTNTITESPYRGELMCFSYVLNKVLIRQPLDGMSLLNHRTDDKFLAGKWGEPLKDVVWKFRGPAEFTEWSCEQQPKIKRLNANVEVNELKLLPGHGTLRFPRDGYVGGDKKFTEWLGEDGRVLGRWSYQDTEYPIRFYFLPWESAYWNGTTGTSRLYRPKGEIEYIPLPQLLLWWQRNNVGDSIAWQAWPGTIWSFVGKVGYWRRQGLYLHSDTGLLRIDDGQWSIPNTLSVSPDGCRIVADRIARDPTRTTKPGPLTMMNFCSESKK
ncbi:MAG: hypothetical protein IPH54_05900 [Rhodoferax sp.]|nr:hypothetical protein [Rhodoferax sp.]